jgi:hypothetical protein
MQKASFEMLYPLLYQIMWDFARVSGDFFKISAYGGKMQKCPQNRGHSGIFLMSDMP